MSNDTFAHGKSLLDSARYPEAVELFRVELQASPKCPRTRMFAAWAQYLDMKHRIAADSRPGDKRLKVLAKKHKTRIQKEQFRVPDFVLGYVFVGRIQLDEGTDRRAMVTFERALRQSPDHSEAQHWHQIAQRRVMPQPPVVTLQPRLEALALSS